MIILVVGIFYEQIAPPQAGVGLSLVDEKETDMVIIVMVWLVLSFIFHCRSCQSRDSKLLFSQLSCSVFSGWQQGCVYSVEDFSFWHGHISQTITCLVLCLQFTFRALYKPRNKEISRTNKHLELPREKSQVIVAEFWGRRDGFVDRQRTGFSTPELLSEFNYWTNIYFKFWLSEQNVNISSVELEGG